jgi:hypothetical protein
MVDLDEELLPANCLRSLKDALRRALAGSGLTG